MGPGGAGGGRVQVPPGAASDLSCLHSGAEGLPPPGSAVALGSGELSSQSPAGSGMSALPRGTPGRPILGSRRPGLARGAGARGRASRSRKGARGAGRAGQVAVLRRRRPARAGRAHLGHEAVGARVLLVLEDDVGIVVGGELLEALRAARDLAFIAPAGAQGLLGHVGAELLVGERHELARRPPPAAHHPARPAAPRRRHQQQQQEQAEPQLGPEPGGRHGRGARASGGGRGRLVGWWVGESTGALRGLRRPGGSGGLQVGAPWAARRGAGPAGLRCGAGARGPGWWRRAVPLGASTLSCPARRPPINRPARLFWQRGGGGGRRAAGLRAAGLGWAGRAGGLAGPAVSTPARRSGGSGGAGAAAVCGAARGRVRGEMEEIRARAPRRPHPTHVPASCALDSEPAARAAQPPPPRAGGPGPSQPSSRSLLRRVRPPCCPRRPLRCLSLPSPPGRAPPRLGLASGLPAAPGCPARRKPPGQELPPPQRPQPTARPDARGGGQWPDRTAAYGVPCGEVKPKGWRPLLTWCPTLAQETLPPSLED